MGGMMPASKDEIAGGRDCRWHDPVPASTFTRLAGWADDASGSTKKVGAQGLVDRKWQKSGPRAIDLEMKGVV